MKKLASRIVLAALVVGLASFAPLALAHDHGEEGTWTGVVTDSGCGAQGASKGADHAKCAHSCVKNKGEKYALYTAADDTVWILSNQEEAGKLAGKKVTVKGKADKEKKTIEVASIAAVAE